MRHLGPPRPWRDVQVGAAVLWKGALRTFLGLAPAPTSRVPAFLEGLGYPLIVHPDQDLAQVVELDETDAMLNMIGAGLEPVVLDVRES